jgi:alkyl hydroperoxide reductase subunit AhpC
VFDDRKEKFAPFAKEEQEARVLGARIVAVCDEKAYNLKSYVERNQLKFVMLADVTGEISAIYGMYDPERYTTAPGFVILDREGVVRLALVGKTLPASDIVRLARLAITGE